MVKALKKFRLILTTQTGDTVLLNLMLNLKR